LHQTTYETLVDSYNDEENTEIGLLQFNHRLYSKFDPSDFDTLTAMEFSQALDFCNHQYQVARKNATQSGEHAPFAKFCWIAFVFYVLS
jgi:hypothetical protein